MSFFNNAGKFTGRAVANVYEGSRLASTQFAQGAREGYTERADELRAARARVLAQGNVEVTIEPVVAKHKRATVTRTA